MDKNKNLDFDLDFSMDNIEIPELDAKTANDMLGNILSACDMEPNTIPVEVLESWGNYKKPRFRRVRRIILFFILLLILLPLMFFKPSVFADRTNTDSVVDAQFEIRVKSLLPVNSVVATLDGVGVEVEKTGSKTYTCTCTSNGNLKITAIAINGQSSSREYDVTYLDTEKPEYVESYSKGGFVYIKVIDTFSGIDYENISGVSSATYDEEKNLLKFEIPEDPTTVIIPDKAGNELSLLLSPIR